MQYVIDLLTNFIVFLTGALFGSFYTLAVYRIPLKKNITRERSFCPNCKHKLGFFDLFPIFSYILLRGRCRYCKVRISSRYVLIELFTAAIFIMFFNSLKFLEVKTLMELASKSVEMLSFMLFYTFMFLTAFIDKEKYKIEDGLLKFGLIVSIVYVLIAYTLKIDVNYLYMLISSTILILLFIIYEVLKEHRIRTRYYIKLIMFFLILSIYIPVRIIGIVIVAMIPIYILMIIVQKIILRKENKEKKQLEDKETLSDEEHIQIKVEISKDKNKVYTVEKRQIVDKSAAKGKLLRLRDLRLKNITDEIHVPFALIVGLISMILFIIFKII